MIYYVTAAQLTNLGRFKVLSKTPSECSDEEIKSFAQVLMEGGEVTGNGVEDRIRAAKVLGFAYEGEVLIGVSALKVPATSYRAYCERNAGVELPASDYPYEAGWLYVKPEYRNAGSGNMLRYLLIQPVLGIHAGSFATTRAENFMPQRLLTKYGFEQKGHVWTSPSTGNRISLFTRDADKGALTSVVASEESHIEGIYMSKALASALDGDRFSRLSKRTPALAAVASLAAEAGYIEASSDLKIAIAMEDAGLAAHALNFLHTETKADLKKNDPDLKIIGDVVPADSMGVAEPEIPDPIKTVGLLFQLATSLPSARKDLDNVQLGVEPSLPHVCMDQLHGLGCPHLDEIAPAVSSPSSNLSSAKEVLTRIDMDLRGKLVEADEVESDRIQRILINLETLMAELFQTGIALASEYVPFGDAIHKASGIRVVGIKALKEKPGVWELIVHYMDGTSLKSVASNKRSLGLCLGMLKVGTKVNFQGTIGRTVEGGMSLEDGRSVRLLDKVHQNAPAETEAVASYRYNPSISLLSQASRWLTNKFSSHDPKVMFHPEQKFAANYLVPMFEDKTHAHNYLRANESDMPHLCQMVNNLMGDSGIVFEVANRPAVMTRDRFALVLKKGDDEHFAKLLGVNEATAGDQSNFRKLCSELNAWSKKGFGYTHTLDEVHGETYFTPMGLDVSPYMGEDSIRSWAKRVNQQLPSLPSGQGVSVSPVQLPGQRWSLLVQSDGGQPSGTSEPQDAAIATASTASDRLYAKIAEKVQSDKPGLKSSSATVTEIAGTVIIVIQDVVLQPEALSTILNKPITAKTKSFVRASGVEFDVERFPGKSGKAGDVSIKFDKARPRQVADALSVLRRLFDTAVSYGKSPAPLEVTAAGEDIKKQATQHISSSLGRLADRARNMYEAVALLAEQESKQNALVEIPLKLKYEMAKCYEAMSGVEALVFRQLDQDKAVIEPAYKALSPEDAKAVAAQFIPMYRDRKVTGFRGALFSVAGAFGTSKPRAVGDLKKLAVSLRPACDLIEATTAKLSA